MTFHRPNNRKAIKARQRAERRWESDFDPLPGEPLIPLRPVIMHAPSIETKRLQLWAGIVAALLVAGLLIVLGKQSLAHSVADWINRGGYKNGAGESCCGERDCFELADGDVKITPSGYFVISIKETVPFSEATPSPDGKYWRCQWGGKRKCFFAPPGST